MSHGKERHEKNCLNCGAQVAGRFCQQCGQENIEPQESFWSIVTHFFNDITHFDGKFFLTAGLLFRKPGFLPKEYMEGRRQRYLNPIRMYIFTSAVFFIVFFSYTKANLGKNGSSGEDTRNSTALIKEASGLASPADTVRYNLVLDSLARRNDSIRNRGVTLINGGAQNYKTKEAYLAAQEQLPPGKRDGWITRKFNMRLIEIDRQAKKDGLHFFEGLLDSFLHQFPKILFISLPFFALTLQLLYRRKKHIWYTGHGMFSIFLYIFSFYLILAGLLFSWLEQFGGTWFWSLLQFGLFLYFFYYNYKAMRYFYGDGGGKTLLKLFLLYLVSFFISLIITAFFFLFSFFYY